MDSHQSILKPTAKPLIEVVTDPSGKTGVVYHCHAGQRMADKSPKRIVAIIAGTRSGKTSFGPIWLINEIQRRGAGDYLIAAPNYPLLDKAAGPATRHLLCTLLGLGKMNERPWSFRMSMAGEQKLWGAAQDKPTRILFGHADDSDSLEAMQAKAAWCDEAGQKKFKLRSWEAIQRRLAIDEGRVLLTSTPYVFGWFKSTVYDPWKRAGGDHPEIDVVQFKSTMNPCFPVAEYARARAALPGWRFRMMYDGLFERPAGQIYDCWEDAANTCKRFAVPKEWPRYVGLDFGGVNTAAVFLAEELAPGRERTSTGRYFAYREYHAGGLTARGHAEALQRGEPQLPTAVGGSKSEDQWRDEFSAGGLPVHLPPVSEVEVGINRVYGAVKARKLVVFDDLKGLLDEIGSYSRVTDDAGNVTEDIEDKSSYHRFDSLRYVCSYLISDEWQFAANDDKDGRGMIDMAPRGVAPDMYMDDEENFNWERFRT